MPNLTPVNSGSPAAAGASIRKAAGSALAGLWRDRRGAAAIEFAMVVPLLLCMYFLSNEVGQAVETSRKLGRGAATIGLVATQQAGSVTKSELEAMMSLGDAALQPYNRSKGDFTVTGVKVNNDATPKAVVVWSRALSNGVAGAGRVKGGTMQIPDTMRTAGTFLVVVEAKLDYKPMIMWSAANKASIGLAAAFSVINMSENSFQVTRDLNMDIACPDC